jgi:hypothetical protein
MKLTLEDFLGILFILGVLMPCYASVLIGAFVLLADCVPLAEHGRLVSDNDPRRPGNFVWGPI